MLSIQVRLLNLVIKYGYCYLVLLCTYLFLLGTQYQSEAHLFIFRWIHTCPAQFYEDCVILFVTEGEGPTGTLGEVGEACAVSDHSIQQVEYV